LENTAKALVIESKRLLFSLHNSEARRIAHLFQRGWCRFVNGGNEKSPEKSAAAFN